MREHVLAQSVVVRPPLAAYGALKGCDLIVRQPDVAGQAGRRDKCGRTQVALVALDVVVHALVRVQFILCSASFGAKVAGVRKFAGVRPHVRLEVRRKTRLEYAAHFTHVQFTVVNFVP